MELRHLRYLIAVADEKSFVAAAAKLQVAQPALSRQIRDLETEVGVELVAREAGGSRLTAAGEAVLRAARIILLSVRSAMERARLAEHGLMGRCVLGAGRYPLANGLVARLIAQVRTEYPGIELVVDDRSLQAQWEGIEACEIDIGIGTAPSTKHAQLAAETYSLDIIDAVIVSASHPLAGRASVTLEELRAETFICYGPGLDSEPTRILQAELTARGFVPAATREVTSPDGLRILVGAGIGWAALPASMRETIPRDLVAIPLSDLAVPFRYVHIHRRTENRPVVRSVLGALRRAARKEGFGAIREPDSGIRTLPEAARAGLASRVELRHLRYFTAVVEHATIGRAAEHLGITQPALSRQVRDLEEEVGATLITRTSRGIVPTLAGASLRTDALRILSVADQLGSEAQRALRGAAGQIVVGVASSPLVWAVVTRAVALCEANHPDSAIIVEDVPTPRQGQAVREARVDLAIGHQHPSLPETDQGVVRIPLLPDVMDVALLHPTHPLADRADIALAELEMLPFLFMKREFSPTFYDQVMSTMARAGYVPSIDGTYDGLPTVWALAAQGIGWCLGSSSQRENPPNGLVAVRLSDFEVPWGCEVSYRRDESRPAILAVLEAVRDAAHVIATTSMASQGMKYWPRPARAG